MNSLKPLFVMVMLAAAAGGVYAYLSSNQSQQTPPLDAAPSWPGGPTAQLPGTSPPMVQIPGSGGPSAPGTPIPPAGGPHVHVPPAAGLGGNTPPRFTPPKNPPVPVAAIPAGTPNLTSPGGFPGTPGSPMPPGSQSAMAGTQPGLPTAPARSPGPGANPVPGGFPPSAADSKFDAYLQTIQNNLDKGQLAEAHLGLSRLYNNPELPIEQAQKITDLLDQLAGTVIYSRQSLLGEPSYLVRPEETLEQIARQYDVPWQLLARINGVRDPQRPSPGTKLKVVRGPFNAVIDLGKHELTMMLNGRYAGRFPIGVGTDYTDLAGTYEVRDKTFNPQYYGPDRLEIGADDPSNPLGEHWIGLGSRTGTRGQIGIHGTPDPASLHGTGGRGCIRLSQQGINDVFGILSIGSRVIVRR